jgi:hypothetical protein
LLAPVPAGVGQTVIVRGRNFPRRHKAIVMIRGRQIAEGMTNSLGNFAAGFVVQRDWPRGVADVISQAGGRQVISKLPIISGRSRSSTEMTASSGATLTVSRLGGPPGTGFRLVTRGLAGRQPVDLFLSGSRVASGRASPGGVFGRWLRVPNLEPGRRELRLNAGRLSMSSFINIYPSRRLPAGLVTMAAAGDIACQPGQPRTFGSCQYAETAKVVGYMNPRVIALLGDYQYFTGSIATAAGAFDGTWGLYKDRMRPALSDHDYQVPNAAGYFTYFGPAARPPNGYYSYNLGPWHIVVLNTNCPRWISCDVGSPQERWLRADLAANSRYCTLAYFHQPRFSSAGRFHGRPLLPIWSALYDYGVDVILNGDAHVYERFAPQHPYGVHDPARGIRQFTVGTGGKDHGRFIRIAPNSERRFNSFGVLGLRLLPGSYQWNFVPIPGYRHRDAGSARCH